MLIRVRTVNEKNAWLGVVGIVDEDPVLII